MLIEEILKRHHYLDRSASLASFPASASLSRLVQLTSQIIYMNFDYVIRKNLFMINFVELKLMHLQFFISVFTVKCKLVHENVNTWKFLAVTI